MKIVRRTFYNTEKAIVVVEGIELDIAKEIVRLLNSQGSNKYYYQVVTDKFKTN